MCGVCFGIILSFKMVSKTHLLSLKCLNILKNLLSYKFGLWNQTTHKNWCVCVCVLISNLIWFDWIFIDIFHMNMSFQIPRKHILLANCYILPNLKRKLICFNKSENVRESYDWSCVFSFMFETFPSAYYLFIKIPSPKSLILYS